MSKYIDQDAEKREEKKKKSGKKTTSVQTAFGGVHGEGGRELAQ